MAQEDWFDDLVAATGALSRRDAGFVVVDLRSGRVIAANDRAASLIGAPVPASVADLVDRGIVARPDLEAFRSQVLAWRRTVPAEVRETAHSWAFDLRVHPPGSVSRVLHVEAALHIRTFDDAAAVILVLRDAVAATVASPTSDGGSHWALYDFQMRGLAFEAGPSLVGDHLRLCGVVVASLVDPEDLARVLPAVVPTVEGSVALARYACVYRAPDLEPQGLDSALRMVQGAAYPTHDVRYLVVSRPTPVVREPIVAGRLTERQTAAVDGIFAGLRPQQIAEAQGVGRKTIRFHLAAAYDALEVAGRDELVARYCPPCLVEEPVTVSVTEEGGERFAPPAGPPGTTGTTETRRLEGIEGWFEVALTRWSAGSGRRPIPPGLLSEKEAAVVAALFDGLRPAAIAERHDVGIKTVRKQLSSAYAKLAVDGQATLTTTYERPAR